MAYDQTNTRYARQTILAKFGESGQQKLLAAKVLMVGAGGLGCAALQYLAAAGLGTIGIIDHDTVALSNLQRQVLYNTHDIGLPKAQQALASLTKLNPEIRITAYNEQLTALNALTILCEYDIIIDGTDNFASRYMINDACCLLDKPLVYGAVTGFEGQVAVFNYAITDSERSANYRDLFPQPPSEGTIANCAEAGVLGVLPGIIGNMQAAEAIKIAAGIGRPLSNRLLTYNTLTSQFFEMAFAKRATTNQLIPANAVTFRQTDYGQLCDTRDNLAEIDSTTFNELLKNPGVLVLDVREYNELPEVNEFEHVQLPLSLLTDNCPPIENDTIIVFCQSGKRSITAARLLADKLGGSKKILQLRGGILHWKQQAKK